MKRWVFVLVICNIIDAVSTGYVLTHGLAVEFNPFVGALYGWHPVLFFVVKSVAVGVAMSVVADQPQKHRLTLGAVTIFYVVLSVYQIVALFFLER